MNKAFQSVISAQRNQVAALEAERDSMIASYAARIAQEKARLEGMEAILEVASFQEMGKEIGKAITAITAGINAGAASTAQMVEKAQALDKRRRPLAPQWQSMLKTIWAAGGATLDEIVTANPNLQRKNIDSALRYYLTQELVGFDTVTRKYSLTDLGREACSPQKGEAQSADNTLGFDFQPLPAGAQNQAG